MKYKQLFIKNWQSPLKLLPPLLRKWSGVLGYKQLTTKTMKLKEKSISGCLWIFTIIVIAIILFLNSCSTTNHLTEDLLEHNPNDLKVLEYKDHKATVLVMPDSVVKTMFSIKPLSKGYLICEKR